ncbi:Nif3-like dinuclear metal center hexameric protein, partial [Desulfofundulus thermobenzoicus]
MTVTGKGICELLEGLAPLELAEPWDNPGWQLGDPGVPVERVLLSLDVDEGVCREAIEMSARLIITHHPLFFKEIKEIRLDSPRGALVAGLIKAGIGVYAAHTNLDSARWGVNDALARRLNLRDIQVLRPVREKYLKLVVFVPLDHVDGVREALGKAGAGWIGNYSDCTFGVQGTGTFRPREGTNPYIGTRGQLEKVPEVRLETILPKRLEKQVIEAMLRAHPYEEVAYDLYPLANSFPTGRGLGRVGN